MANINAGTARRFENGGSLTIATNTVLQIEAGSLKWKPGLREPIPLTDRGNRGPVLEGDERETELELDVKYTSVATVGEIYQLLTAAGTNGLANKVAVVIKIPAYRGSATGDQITFANCYVPSGGLDVESSGAGPNVDHLKIKLMDAEAAPAVVTY